MTGIWVWVVAHAELLFGLTLIFFSFAFTVVMRARQQGRRISRVMPYLLDPRPEESDSEERTEPIKGICLSCGWTTASLDALDAHTAQCSRRGTS